MKGTKKSWVLTALPCGVEREICPEVVDGLTVVIRLVCPAPTELTLCKVILFCTRLLFAYGSKFVPVMVTTVPETPMEGVNPVIVGALDGVRLKFAPLVADPDALLT
jgi:hypothetical protein